MLHFVALRDSVKNGSILGQDDSENIKVLGLFPGDFCCVGDFGMVAESVFGSIADYPEFSWLICGAFGMGCFISCGVDFATSHFRPKS